MTASRPTTPKPGAPFGKSEPPRQPQKPQSNEPVGPPPGDAGNAYPLNVGSGERPKTPKPGTGR